MAKKAYNKNRENQNPRARVALEGFANQIIDRQGTVLFREGLARRSPPW
jgi:hypothetical protein